jgi:hypothetical protein
MNTAITVRKMRQKELEKLYAERAVAFEEVQRAKEILGKAENKLYSIKAQIAEIHKANGQRG